ncbi:DUF4112 domain-containing protein [Jiella sp. MQZ9-1]|uniref:DUF4112 domain-containing protein n=1 Tax=Jiella flava TaxID=2816857 RepID=A0A939JT56_9HYPH|nr:DUF4112 domain-containing protein [Jiella flava]MBO0663633.1 DUF4112 domain-containing protein [Jiella flava]MCD2472208.1 DUF4112 domain-containing protein [Jiella flava]
MSTTYAENRAFAGSFDDADRLRRLRRISKVARLMDTAIRIPGTGISFGGDSIVGLVPGIGDAGAALVSLWIVNEARRLGMPTRKLVKMLANVGIDTFGGAVPIVGDIFDVFFKANRKNLAIILEHFDEDVALDESDEPRPMKDITPNARRAA